MDVTYDEWGLVARRVVNFCHLDVTEVSEFGSGVSTRTLGMVTGADEGIDRNIMTNYMSKVLSNSIYIDYNLVTSVNYS